MYIQHMKTFTNIMGIIALISIAILVFCVIQFLDTTTWTYTHYSCELPFTYAFTEHPQYPIAGNALIVLIISLLAPSILNTTLLIITSILTCICKYLNKSCPDILLRITTALLNFALEGVEN